MSRGTASGCGGAIRGSAVPAASARADCSFLNSFRCDTAAPFAGQFCGCPAPDALRMAVAEGVAGGRPAGSVEGSSESHPLGGGGAATGEGGAGPGDAVVPAGLVSTLDEVCLLRKDSCGATAPGFGKKEVPPATLLEGCRIEGCVL